VLLGEVRSGRKSLKRRERPKRMKRKLLEPPTRMRPDEEEILERYLKCAEVEGSILTFLTKD